MKAFATFIILTTLSLNIMAQQKIVQTAGRTQLGVATGKLLADLTVGMALMMQVLGGMGGA